MNEEFEFITNLALDNDYPLRFIQSRIRKTLNKYLERSNTPRNPTSKSAKLDDTYSKSQQLLIDLPYIGNETKILAKKLAQLAQTTRPGLHIQPIPRPSRAPETFFPQKDKILKDYQSNIVYMISCSECDVSYVGKTVREAFKRHQEHGAPQQIKSSPCTRTDVHTPPDQHLSRSDRNKGKPKINYCAKHDIS
ncbi:unnamed protein product [Rotaria sp. Silwood2]|nr:unnamed protein product [Rotaria sp. Silwood2]CAF3193987.1 unnamed protein product [Rotaria sp. Silwood2]CAF3389462.1 unnamed protein product [Rotaria sp. Silwood2]CAF3485384.1 unnamed protein product [Rotaria sp. Silwood2]CAF4562624.1 unnamed protein product [Rotaria sp. Silwood2]